jgi:hypothetical protein
MCGIMCGSLTWSKHVNSPVTLSAENMDRCCLTCSARTCHNAHYSAYYSRFLEIIKKKSGRLNQWIVYYLQHIIFTSMISKTDQDAFYMYNTLTVLIF